MTLKITILGCGSAYGVPAIGGYWGDCNPENKKNHRTRSSIMVENENTRILIDISPDFREQSSRHEVGYFDAVLVSHSHADHIVGLIEIPLMMAIYHTGDLPCYAHSKTLEGIKKMFWYQFSNEDESYYGEGKPVWSSFEHDKPMTVNSIEIIPFNVSHGNMFTSGFRIKDIGQKSSENDVVYTPDIGTLNENTHNHLEDVHTWIVDCDTLEEPRDGSHSYLEKTKGWIDKIKPEKAYLTHLDFTLDYDETSKEIASNTELCFDGMVIEV